MTDVERSDLTVALRRVRRIANLWDEAIRIPLLGWRIGLDPLVGLVPGAGDLVGLIVGLYPLVLAAGLGVGPAVLGRMALNLTIDAVAGSVPLLGDVFDVLWQANTRNRDLLERWVEDPRRVRRDSRTSLAIVAATGLAVLALLVWLVVQLVGWLT